jgi:protein-S-isoprenylcysteine O-methyltransferase Ste14
MVALNSLYIQLIPVAISILGALAVIPGPDRAGNLRIPGLLGRMITFTGIMLFVCPWVAAPIIDQPRFQGGIGIALLAIGIVLVLGGFLLYAISFKYLWPAFKLNYNEFAPADLITTGPYSVVRHPIYLAVFLLLGGLSCTLRAELTILMLPFLFAELKFITIYEENCILGKRFPEESAVHKEAVPKAIVGMGFGAGIIVVYTFVAVFILVTVFGRG